MIQQLLLRLFARMSTAPATRLADGSLLLQMAPVIRGLLRLLRLFGGALAIAGLVGAFKLPPLLVVTALGLALFWAAGRNIDAVVLLDATGIAVRGAGGRHQKAAWPELADVAFSRPNWRWHVRTKDGAKISFPGWLVGSHEFPLWLHDHIDRGKWKAFEAGVARYHEQLRFLGINTFALRQQSRRDREAPPTTVAASADDDDDD